MLLSFEDECFESFWYRVKIALLAPIEESVPPKKYGGTERVVFNLAEELVGLGHEVDLYATADSKTSANLIPVTDKPIRNLLAQNPREWFSKEIEAAYFVTKSVRHKHYDIIHSNLDEPFTLVNRYIREPVVTTLHNPVPLYLEKAYEKQHFISISNSQRKLSPGLDYVATVYNGIKVSSFEFNPKPKNYLMFLGRISPDKGIVEAIHIAKKTRNKLVIVAKVDPPERAFYRNIVKPLIDNKQITYLGEVDEQRKIEILKDARALISPIQWDEPFGLVNIEALACGVPVISIARGSIPEIFMDARVGYLCNNVEQMITKVGQIDKISRKVCRAHVEKYFDSKIMAQNYVKAYRKVIRQRLNHLKNK